MHLVGVLLEKTFTSVALAAGEVGRLFRILCFGRRALCAGGPPLGSLDGLCSRYGLHVRLAKSMGCYMLDCHIIVKKLVKPARE